MKLITKVLHEHGRGYSAPTLEAFSIQVEQGFQSSAVVTSNWDSALESERTWETTNETELF